MNRQSAAKALSNIKLYGQSSTTSHNDVLFRINNPIEEMEKYKQFIYVLTEPDSLIVRYVGRTSEPYNRLNSHIYESNKVIGNTHKKNWLLKLKKSNDIPRFHIIDYIEKDDVSLIDKMENYYILELSKVFKLTNYYKIHKDEIYFKRTLDIGAKPVCAFDANCKYIKTFITSRQCSLELNIPLTSICNGIHKKQLVSKKYYFSRTLEFTPYKGPGKGSHMFKVVYEFDKNSNLINQFKSCKEVGETYNLNSASVHGSITQKSKLKGHIFSYDKNYVHTTKSRGDDKACKILVLDFEDNVIGTYNSMAECKRELNYKGDITNLIKIGGVSKKLKCKFKFV